MESESVSVYEGVEEEEVGKFQEADTKDLSKMMDLF